MRPLSAILLGLCGAVIAAEPVLTVSGGIPDMCYANWATIDSQLAVEDADGGTIDGMRVVIDDLASGDLLRVSSAVSLPGLGLSATYDGGTGVLSVTGSMSATDAQQVLRAVQIKAVAGSAGRTIRFVLGQAVGYQGAGHSTTHYYQYIGSGSSITWTAAKAAAAARSYFGLQGYLSTITSSGENAFIRDKLGSDAWIGASDAVAEGASEGEWRWVSGPEAGTQFSSGNITPVAVGGQFVNWNAGEPNNSGNTEHFGEVYNSGGSPGRWNDLPDNDGSVLGYVVEYGDMAGDPVVAISGVRTIALIANTAPSFTLGNTAVSVVENAGAQSIAGFASAISAGPTQESAQTVTFVIDSVSNASLFSTAPAIATDGTLTFAVAADTSGTSTVVVHAHDDGGTAGGGSDSSATRSFTIAVAHVNRAPSFTLSSSSVSVLEDCGAQVVTGLATSISAGAGESGQAVHFVIDSSSNAALFSTAPAVSASGTLTFTPAANANGSSVIVLHVQDDGGTMHGGVDVSAGRSLTITVVGVNDAPSCTLSEATMNVTRGTHFERENFIASVSSGPQDEAAQSVHYEVVVGYPNLFGDGINQPIVSPSGTLLFSATRNGTTTITITPVDNGGTVSGGVNRGQPQVCSITTDLKNDQGCATGGILGVILVVSVGLGFRLRRRGQ